MISDFIIPTASELYRSVFRDLLYSGSSRLVQNSSPLHARIIISELIQFAQRSVDIFCDSLSPDIWNESSVRDAIKIAINKGVEFRVITQNTPNESETRDLISSVTGIKTLKEKVSLPNFIIADKKAYRLEIDEEKKIGIACADGAKDAAGIAEAFEHLYAQNT